jgi:hypothetical protein
MFPTAARLSVTPKASQFCWRVVVRKSSPSAQRARTMADRLVRGSSLGPRSAVRGITPVSICAAARPFARRRSVLSPRGTLRKAGKELSSPGNADSRPRLSGQPRRLSSTSASSGRGRREMRPRRCFAGAALPDRSRCSAQKILLIGRIYRRSISPAARPKNGSRCRFLRTLTSCIAVSRSWTPERKR